MFECSLLLWSKTFEDFWFFECVARLEGICKKRHGPHWRQLPEVSAEDDVDTSEGSALTATACVRMATAGSTKVGVEQAQERRGGRAGFVDDDPANSERVHKERVDNPAAFTFVLGHMRRARLALTLSSLVRFCDNWRPISWKRVRVTLENHGETAGRSTLPSATPLSEN